MSQINLPKIYNPQNQTRKELIDNFVVRLDIFKEIFNDIKSSKMQHPEQHYIIQGIRGQGKTTLLLRIAYEIENEPKLNKKLITVVFNEEQYSINKLFKLWEATAEYLNIYTGFEDLYDRMRCLEFDDDYENRCFQLIEKYCKHNKKKLILFIDNIDAIFGKFSKKEHHRFREVLIESAEFRIIGASAVSLEFHYDYGKPFYEFFRMVQIKGLYREETQTLLLSLGRYYKRDQIKRIIKDQPGRVEALRRITNGVIRTIIILYGIFADEKEGNAFQDLEDTLDKVTLLYKHRMDNLSAQQQEIMDFIALSWDAVSTKEIAQKTRIASKAVSAQLKFLQKNHIIEQQATSTKNHLYRLSERFFNIWYLMRHGRKQEENRVRFLVEFLQIWCDEKELENRAYKQLEAIQKGKIYEKQALYMSEALACTINDRKLQDRLVKQTRNYLEECNPELLADLSYSDDELKEKAIKSIKGQKDKKLAIQHLEKIKHKEIDELRMLADYYFLELKDPEKARIYLLRAIEKGDTQSVYKLAFLYQTEFKEFKKAEKYYLMAVDKGNNSAMYNLAFLYQTEFKDFKKAEKYYLMAVDKGNNSAMYNLALLYKAEFRDFKKAEKYYLMAVDKGNNSAMYNLALLYQTKFKDFKKAEKYYLMAVDKGNNSAMYNLALLYQTEFKDFKKAEDYYLKAINKDHSGAMYNLALLYETKFKDFKKAEDYYLKAIEKGHADAMYNLSYLYKTEFSDFEKAEEYYLKAIEKGNTGAMNSLAWMYYENKSDKEKALRFAKKGYTDDKNIYIAHTYTMTLLWNDEIEKALEISKDFMESEKSYEKFSGDIRDFLMLLIAKKQYHETLKIFNENPFSLKDRYKPVYYALMYFLQDEYPNEYRKMGSELKETVEEIIKKIGQLEKDYK